jgi:hypothetical protein
MHLFPPLPERDDSKFNLRVANNPRFKSVPGGVKHFAGSELGGLGLGEVSSALFHGVLTGDAVLVGVRGCAGRIGGESASSFSGSRDGRRVTSYGCRGPPGRTPGRLRSFAGGSLVGVAAGSLDAYKRIVEAENGRAGTVASNKHSGNRSSGGSGSGNEPLIVNGSPRPIRNTPAEKSEDIESDIEFVPPPHQ